MAHDEETSRAGRRWSSRRWVAVAAILALTLAAAILRQESGPNQAAHFALVRALASGTAEIDARETIDAAFVNGHYYAAKAPGLAMLSVPWYAVLRAGGLQENPLESAETYRDRLWALTLFGAVIPWFALLTLMRSAVERVTPGYGTSAAVLLGAGTLLLPFSTLFFAHMLSATLGFGAFWLLLRGRGRGSPWWHAGIAGAVAGFAMVVEFGLAIVVVVLGCLVLAGEGRGRRFAAYAAGTLAGVTPLLAYNTWAFGSPTTLSYTNALTAPAGSGAPEVGANEAGLYGVTLPDLREALSLLFSEKGLVVVSPLCVVALAGLPLLWRGERRAETLCCATVPTLFLAYNAAYYLPFGGQGPGPRFLVPAIPFLVLPLAAALRAWPLVVAGVGIASAVVMGLATVTGPVTGVEHGVELWLERLRDGDFAHTPVGSARRRAALRSPRRDRPHLGHRIAAAADPVARGASSLDRRAARVARSRGCHSRTSARGRRKWRARGSVRRARAGRGTCGRVRARVASRACVPAADRACDRARGPAAERAATLVGAARRADPWRRDRHVVAARPLDAAQTEHGRGALTDRTAGTQVRSSRADARAGLSRLTVCFNPDSTLSRHNFRVQLDQ